MADKKNRISREEFLLPETRCDTFVSAEKKKILKVQLDLVEIAIDICKRHNLKLSATGGTLLGAVRHGGYIPWDDDIDLMLPRGDYMKFLQIAEKELKPPYRVVTQLNSPSVHYNGSYLENSDTAALISDWVADRIYAPQGIIIDLCVIDEMPADMEELSRRIKRAFQIRSLRHRAFMHNHKTLKDWIKHIVGLSFFKLVGNKRIYDYQENLFVGLKNPSKEFCGEAPANWPVHKALQYRVPRNCFDEMTTLPFEYLDMPVCSCYEKILDLYYGNWHEFVKDCSCHDEREFHVDKSYKQVMLERYGVPFSAWD